MREYVIWRHILSIGLLVFCQNLIPNITIASGYMYVCIYICVRRSYVLTTNLYLIQQKFTKCLLCVSVIYCRKFKEMYNTNMSMNTYHTELCVYIHIYIHMHTHTHIYTHTETYIFPTKEVQMKCNRDGSKEGNSTSRLEQDKIRSPKVAVVWTVFNDE